MSTFLVETYLNVSTRLDGGNYVNWKFKVLSILERNNLWPIVSGAEPKPTAMAIIPDWEIRETKAKVLLRMSIKENIIPHIRDCKASKETWGVLKSLYETSNTNRIFLKTKLLSIKMEANESISNFISRVKELSDKLGDIGEKVFNTNLVTITLNGLVHDYQIFISSLSAREKPHVFDELTYILLQEEGRMKNFNLGSNNSDLALVAKGKQPYKSKPWEKIKGGKFQAKQKGMAQSKFPVHDKRNDDCYYCGKP